MPNELRVDVGAPEDFDRWYRSQYSHVLSVLALAVGNRDVARDATDEAFTRALERWERVARLDAPTAWTIRVALNVARRTFSRRNKELELFERIAPREAAHADIYLAELVDLMNQLTVRARTAIALRYVMMMHEDEIADVMGVSPGTVATTLHRARKRLAAALERDHRHALRRIS